MSNCELPKCFPVSLDDSKDYSSSFSEKNTELFENQTYTCPENWIQTLEGDNNGSCSIASTCGTGPAAVKTFKYGPNYGGFPKNRRSAADFCVDLGNGNDWSQTFKTNMSSTWPPTSASDVLAIAQSDLYNKGQTNSGYAGSAGQHDAAKKDTTTSALQKITIPPDQALAAALAGMQKLGGATAPASTGAADSTGGAGSTGAAGSTGGAEPLYGSGDVPAPYTATSDQWISGIDNTIVMVGGGVLVLIVIVMLVK